MIPIRTRKQAEEAARRALADLLPSVVVGPPTKDHIVCCNPTTALCGADQRGEPFALGAPDPKRMCTACAALAKDPNHKCCKECPGDVR